MNKQRYEAIIAFLNRSAILKKMVLTIVYLLPIFNVIVYVSILAVLFFDEDVRLIRVMLVPAMVFGAVTVFRNCLNAPRPYDMLGYQPLIPVQAGKGKSFPSRHTASAVIIALAIWYLHTAFGVGMMILAVLIGVSRILVGVHYLKDVICGASISLLFGVIGFWII